MAQFQERVGRSGKITLSGQEREENRRLMRRLTAWGVGILIATLPWLFVWWHRPALNDLREGRAVEIGTVHASDADRGLEVLAFEGDVLRPKRKSREISYDMAVFACFYDPWHIDDKLVEPLNPTLWSVLRASASSEAQLSYFITNLVRALQESQETVASYASVGRGSSAGDYLTPSIWPVYAAPGAERDRGVKYLAALPLFNPDLLSYQPQPELVRTWLKRNLIAAIRRLNANVRENDRGSKIRSYGLPALGSTLPSHDSPYFLSFDEGFIAILTGLEKGDWPPGLDRVFLVAYDRLPGEFEVSAVNGLQAAADYLSVRTFTQRGNFILISAVVSLGFVLVVFPLQGKRLRTTVGGLGDIAGTATIPPIVAWWIAVGLTDVLPRHLAWLALSWHSIATLLCVFVLVRQVKEVRPQV